MFPASAVQIAAELHNGAGSVCKPLQHLKENAEREIRRYKGTRESVCASDGTLETKIFVVRSHVFSPCWCCLKLSLLSFKVHIKKNQRIEMK